MKAKKEKKKKKRKETTFQKCCSSSYFPAAVLKVAVGISPQTGLQSSSLPALQKRNSPANCQLEEP